MDFESDGATLKRCQSELIGISPEMFAMTLQTGQRMLMMVIVNNRVPLCSSTARTEQKHLNFKIKYCPYQASYLLAVQERETFTLTMRIPVGTVS